MQSKQDYKTKARQYILECLEKNADKTVSASNVLKYLEENEISANLTTVYRYLNRLTKEKKINKFTGENGQKAVFQLSNSDKICDEHIHVQCVDCGKLIHLDCDFMSEFKNHLFDEHGFNLKCSGSILYGTCSSCKKNK